MCSYEAALHLERGDFVLHVPQEIPYLFLTIENQHQQIFPSQNESYSHFYNRYLPSIQSHHMKVCKSAEKANEALFSSFFLYLSISFVWHKREHFDVTSISAQIETIQ